MKNYIRSITIDIHKRRDSKYQEVNEFENQISEDESVDEAGRLSFLSWFIP